MKFNKLAVLAAAVLLPVLLQAETHSPVTILEDDSTFTLDNGIVTARVAKRSGDLTSLKYKNLEMLDAADRQAGYWEHNTARAQVADTITIDPKTNAGERGEHQNLGAWPDRFRKLGRPILQDRTHALRYPDHRRFPAH